LSNASNAQFGTLQYLPHEVTSPRRFTITSLKSILDGQSPDKPVVVNKVADWSTHRHSRTRNWL